MNKAAKHAANSGIRRLLATLLTAALLMSAAVLTAGTASAQALDTDGDKIEDAIDSCPTVKNRNQSDLDSDGIGDKCDDDIDGDGIANADDDRPRNADVGIDTDGDRINDDVDNCPTVKNRQQNDLDGDGLGNKCDDDIDGDGILNEDDDRPRKEDPVTEIEIEVVDLGDLDADIIVVAPLPTMDIDGGNVLADPFVPTGDTLGTPVGGCSFAPLTEELTIGSSVNVGTFELSPVTDTAQPVTSTDLAPLTFTAEQPVALQPVALQPMALEPVAVEPIALEPIALEPAMLTVTGEAPLVYEAPSEPTVHVVSSTELTLEATVDQPLPSYTAETIVATDETPSVCS